MAAALNAVAGVDEDDFATTINAAVAVEGAVGAAVTAGELAQACGERELSAQVEAYQAEIDALVLGAYPTDDEIEEEALYMYPAYADLLCREADISAGAASDSDIELDKLQRAADSAESSMGWQEDYVLKAEAEVKEEWLGRARPTRRTANSKSGLPRLAFKLEQRPN